MKIKGYQLHEIILIVPLMIFLGILPGEGKAETKASGQKNKALLSKLERAIKEVKSEGLVK